MADIKNLLNDIIKDTDNSYKTTAEKMNDDSYETASFDKAKFREKISMFVLKDIVSAMMHDETADLELMIDSSIEKHIADNYGGSCYGYLTNARNSLKSPIIGNIIQEIDNKTQKVSDQICAKKDSSVGDAIDVKDILDGVENYDDLRQKIKDQVSKKVIDDVTGVITSSNDAPVFDDIDEKLAKTDDENDVTSESVILNMTSAIVIEYATEHIKTGETMSVEDGVNQAIVEYCICEMDKLFKQIPKVNMIAKRLYS